MCDFSEIVMLRSMLIREGISFYDLEDKRSSPYESSTASWARGFLRSERLTVQDLKKGTIYEELERKGDMSKEEIEEKVKAMADVKPITKADEEKLIIMMRTLHAKNDKTTFANEAKGNTLKNRNGHKMVIRSYAEIMGKSYKEEGISSTVNKDKETCRVWDKKEVQKLKKIEIQKSKERRFARENRPYMGWPAASTPSTN